jgi:hypothetical protein
MSAFPDTDTRCSSFRVAEEASEALCGPLYSMFKFFHNPLTLLAPLKEGGKIALKENQALTLPTAC